MATTTTPTSYNGWPAIPSSADPRLTVITPVGGRHFRVRAGDVATIFDWLISRYHAEVEPIDVGQLDDWSYAYRQVRAGASLSNHASGTAVDLNALKHPFNTSAARSMTAVQIARCKQLVADSSIDGQPVLRWLDGHDPMHWEINRWANGGSSERVAALADRLRGHQPTPAPTPTPTITPKAPKPIAWKKPPADLTGIVQEIAGAHIDHVYGPKTTSAVRDLQRRLGMRHTDRDGRFGPHTARTYLATLPWLRIGSRGPGVKLAQWIVGAHIDGKYGTRTHENVRATQAWAGLTPDGIIGPDTRTKIIR